MKDLVSIMSDENSMTRMGFNMLSDEEPKEEKGERYSEALVSQYTRTVATAEGAAKYRKTGKIEGVNN